MCSHHSYRTRVANDRFVPRCQSGAKRRKIQKPVRYEQVVPNKVWRQNFGRCCYHRHTTLKREKTPQSVEITAFLVRLPGLEPGASGLGVTIITYTSSIVVLHDSRSTPNYTVFRGAISSFDIVDTPLYLLVFRSAISKMLAVLQRSQNLNQLVRF